MGTISGTTHIKMILFLSRYC